MVGRWYHGARIVAEEGWLEAFLGAAGRCRQSFYSFLPAAKPSGLRTVRVVFVLVAGGELFV